MAGDRRVIESICKGCERTEQVSELERSHGYW